MNASLLKKHWPLLFSLILLLVNVILKIIYLDSRDIAMDEPFTIFFAQADIFEIFKMLPGENNPPLYFLLLHFWIKLFGISAFSVRFLPFVFSVLTALVIFRIGQRFFSVNMGMLASLIYTFSNYQMVFAHETRVYSLFALLTACSMYLLMKMGKQPGSGKTIFLFTLVNILLIYSHFFGFLVIGTEILALFMIRHFRDKIMKPMIISTGFTLLAYIPYLPVFIARSSLSANSGTWVSPPVLSDLYTMLWRYSNAPVTTVFFIGILLAGFIVWLIKRQGKQSTVSAEGKLLLVWFLIPYLFMFAVSFRIPVFLDRYTIFLSIGFYLVLAMSLESISENRWVFGLLTITTLLLMVTTFTPNVDNKRRLKEVAGKIRNYKGPGTIVVICPSWLEYGFAYHYRPDYFMDYRNLRKRLNAEGIYPVNSLGELDGVVLKKATSVLYLEEWATLVDKENRILNSLSTGFSHLPDERVYESFIIHRFTEPKND